MSKTTAGVPDRQHPDHPDAITAKDLVPKAIVRCHRHDGTQTDYLVVGLPFESQPGYYRVPVRQITPTEGQRPLLGRTQKPYLTAMGILPYGSKADRWYKSQYTIMLKRP